jgi:phosphoribosylaminoimidazole-succinocarboxamide synthase
MLVWRGKPILLECIVRGRLLGSSNDSYQETGDVCGIKLPKGLKKGDELIPPIFTPSTKAEKGEHDENITFEQAEKLVGVKTARYLRKKSLELFKYISKEMLLTGVELTDTKFEYIYLKRGNKKEIRVSDEIATPDSSRFEPDYSKEPLRQWLASIGWDGTPIELPEKIITETSQRYIKGCEILTGYKVTV